MIQGQVAYRRGDLADAEAYIASGIELGAGHGFDTVIAWGAASHVLVLAERGDVAAAAQVLARFRLDGPLPDTAHLCEARSRRGRTLIESRQLRRGDRRPPRGRPPDGRRSARVNPDYAPWRAYLAPALLLTGEVDEACALADEQLELARAWGAKPALAGRCGCTVSPRRPELRESVEVARDSPARLELAQSLVELGAAERRANQRTARPRAARGGDRRSPTAAAPAASRSGRCRSSSQPARARGARRRAAATP